MARLLAALLVCMLLGFGQLAEAQTLAIQNINLPIDPTVFSPVTVTTFAFTHTITSGGDYVMARLDEIIIPESFNRPWNITATVRDKFANGVGPSCNFYGSMKSPTNPSNFINAVGAPIFLQPNVEYWVVLQDHGTNGVFGQLTTTTDIGSQGGNGFIKLTFYTNTFNPGATPANCTFSWQTVSASLALRVGLELTPCVFPSCTGRCGPIVDNCERSGSCQPCCVPQPCNGRCGSVPDGCGGTLNCGACPCVPDTSCGNNCGSIPDGCGGTHFCACPRGSRCCDDGRCHANCP